MLNDAERLIMTVVAFGVAGVFLIAIADTPAYPAAIGIELIVLFYLLSVHGKDIASKLTTTMKLGGLQP